MPEALRSEIVRIVDSRHVAKCITPETQREIVNDFEYFCGYANEECKEDIVSLEPFLNEPFVKQYAFWLRQKRKCKRTTVVGRICRMFSALETFPDFMNNDYSWIHSIYRKLRKEPESALKARRRQRYVAFEELVAIPARMRDERKALPNATSISHGWRLMDELLLTFLILAQYPPRFVRQASIGVNIFKGPVPEGGPPFQIPKWAKELLLVDPGTQFWQFRHESSEGKLFRGLVLRQVVPLLELYLSQFRPMLIGTGSDPGTVFFDRTLHCLSCCRLTLYTANLSRRYAKKVVTPTAIRSSFAHYFRERHPDQDAVLANIQWVQYATIKMRYDEEFRRQRRARAARRKNQYS
jgi:hypothetical protein